MLDVSSVFEKGTSLRNRTEQVPSLYAWMYTRSTAICNTRVRSSSSHSSQRVPTVPSIREYAWTVGSVTFWLARTCCKRVSCPQAQRAGARSPEDVRATFAQVSSDLDSPSQGCRLLLDSAKLTGSGRVLIRYVVGFGHPLNRLTDEVVHSCGMTGSALHLGELGRLECARVNASAAFTTCGNHQSYDRTQKARSTLDTLFRGKANSQL